MPTRFLIGLPLAAALVLAGCDKPKERHPPASPDAAASAPAKAASLPPLPAWAKDMIGKAKADLFPGEPKPCIGNTDNVEQKFADGVKIVGWGWDPETKAPVPRVILVDVTGLVAGAGETGVTRPDVNAAKPEITSPTTGWAALTSRTTGPVDAFGILADGKSLCVLGHLEF
jgi:hypothetical protein